MVLFLLFFFFFHQGLFGSFFSCSTIKDRNLESASFDPKSYVVFDENAKVFGLLSQENVHRLSLESEPVNEFRMYLVNLDKELKDQLPKYQKGFEKNILVNIKHHIIPDQNMFISPQPPYYEIQTLKEKKNSIELGLEDIQMLPRLEVKQREEGEVELVFVERRDCGSQSFDAKSRLIGCALDYLVKTGCNIILPVRSDLEMNTYVEMLRFFRPGLPLLFKSSGRFLTNPCYTIKDDLCKKFAQFAVGCDVDQTINNRSLVHNMEFFVNLGKLVDKDGVSLIRSEKWECFLNAIDLYQYAGFPVLEKNVHNRLEFTKSNMPGSNNEENVNKVSKIITDLNGLLDGFNQQEADLFQALIHVYEINNRLVRKGYTSPALLEVFLKILFAEDESDGATRIAKAKKWLSDCLKDSTNLVKFEKEKRSDHLARGENLKRIMHRQNHDGAYKNSWFERVRNFSRAIAWVFSKGCTLMGTILVLRYLSRMVVNLRHA